MPNGIVQVFFEVKNDGAWYPRSGNISAEYVQEKQRGTRRYKWSGLTVTKADLWVNLYRERGRRIARFAWVPILRRNLLFDRWETMDDSSRDNAPRRDTKGTCWTRIEANKRVSDNNPLTKMILMNVGSTVDGKAFWGKVSRTRKGASSLFSRKVDWTKWARGCGK